MLGFQSGTCGISFAVLRRKSCRWVVASPSSGLLGVCSEAGLAVTNGGWNESTSELDRVFPGISAGARKASVIAA